MGKISLEYLDKIILYLPRIPLALVIIAAGWLTGKGWNKFYMKISKNSRIDPLARKYIGRFVYIAVFALSIIIALSVLGLNISPFIAGIGAGGLIIGFGVRETVADFSSGMMIFMYRPFKIGDYVKIGGVEGEIVAISPVNIELKGKDNKKILVPNRSAWGQIIYNFTREGKNIVTLQLAISEQVHDINEILKSFLENKGIDFKCFLTGVSVSGVNYTIYLEVPKEKIFATEEIIKNIWSALKDRNINATITFQS